jgi:hypothetical protein
MEIHNPANPHLKLKYFSSSNVGSTALSSRRLTLVEGDNSVDINESFRELLHMEDFKQAVHTMMKAMSLALPWNYTVSALESFLFGSTNCAEKTAGWPNRAKELSDFVDHVLHTNSKRWVSRQHFLDAVQLRPVFDTWMASRPAGRFTPVESAAASNADYHKQSSFSKAKAGKSGKFFAGGGGGYAVSYGGGGGNFSAKSGGGHYAYSAPVPSSSGGGHQNASGGGAQWAGSFRDLCRRYNTNGCDNSHRHCTTGLNGSGTKLYHLCSFKKSNGKPCGGTHPESKHR